MQVILKRLNLSLYFAYTCYAILLIAMCIMVCLLYPAVNVIAEVKAVSFEVEEDGSTETIATERLMDDKLKISDNVGIVDLSYVVQTTESTIEDIDLSFLSNSEYLPVYKYGECIEPSIDIPHSISETDMRNYVDIVDTSEYLYIGTYAITGYTPKCYHCCGNINGVTASGVDATVGYTVAADKSIPFGTTLYIEGYGYYVVEDRGNFGEKVIDIAAPNHDACYNLTNIGVNVYVVPLSNNKGE